MTGRGQLLLGLWAALECGALAAHCAASPDDRASAPGQAAWVCRSQHLGATRVLWCAASDAPEGVAVWRAALRGRTACRASGSGGDRLAVAEYGRGDVAAWLSKGRLGVWHDGATTSYEAGPSPPAAQVSRPRWAEGKPLLAWTERSSQEGGGALHLFSLESGAVDAVPAPAGVEFRTNGPPVWEGGADRVWVLAEAGGNGGTLLGWSVSERRWYAWDHPLPDLPALTDYRAHADQGWFLRPSSAVATVPAQAFAQLDWLSDRPGSQGYSIVPPRSWLDEGLDLQTRLGPRSITLPLGTTFVVSRALDAAVCVSRDREGRCIVVRVGVRRLFNFGKRRSATAVTAPRDTVRGQEAAIGPRQQAFLLAGRPGKWRILEVDFGTRTVKDLVTLGN